MNRDIFVALRRKWRTAVSGRIIIENKMPSGFLVDRSEHPDEPFISPQDENSAQFSVECRGSLATDCGGVASGHFDIAQGTSGPRPFSRQTAIPIDL
jgi:hypothetical protein